MAYIEGELFSDQRTNMIAFKNQPVDFIGMESR
jgi:hypothetical protein